MRQLLSVVVGLVLVGILATSADARHRRHRGHEQAASLNDADCRRAAQRLCECAHCAAAIGRPRKPRKTLRYRRPDSGASVSLRRRINCRFFRRSNFLTTRGTEWAL